MNRITNKEKKELLTHLKDGFERWNYCKVNKKFMNICNQLVQATRSTDHPQHWFYRTTVAARLHETYETMAPWRRTLYGMAKGKDYYHVGPSELIIPERVLLQNRDVIPNDVFLFLTNEVIPKERKAFYARIILSHIIRMFFTHPLQSRYIMVEKIMSLLSESEKQKLFQLYTRAIKLFGIQQATISENVISEHAPELLPIIRESIAKLVSQSGGADNALDDLKEHVGTTRYRESGSTMILADDLRGIWMKVPNTMTGQGLYVNIHQDGLAETRSVGGINYVLDQDAADTLDDAIDREMEERERYDDF